MPKRFHRRRSPATPPHRATPATAPTPTVPPRLPLVRDRWAWASALAVVPLVVHSLGAPLGEPVLDDFYFLHRVLLSGRSSLFDAGGLLVYWRPLSRQLYYTAFGPLMLAHPRWLAAVHALLLAMAVLLLYRALRRRWPGPWAATAATFPLLIESSRMLLSWPSHFQDLGVLLFAALALHEAACRRLPTALLALLAALLCKEVAMLAALLLPWMPDHEPGRPRARLRWAAATAALVAAWGAVYVAVFHRAHLLPPSALDVHTLQTPLAIRVLWALGHSLLDGFSLSALSPPWGQALGAALALLAAVALGWYASSRAVRARLRRALPWAAWGCVWFAGSAAAVADLYPAWATYRSSFCAFGLGVALTALLGATHATLLAALWALRLLAFALSPGPPPRITAQPLETGAAFDFPKLIRLQRVAVEARHVLHRRYATLPHGARVGQHYLPRMVEYAFVGDKALQVWYRDTTLRWVRFEDFRRHPGMALVTFVEYQPSSLPQTALVDPEPMRGLLRASELVGESRFEAALAELNRADSLQSDRNAAVFLGALAGERALCALGRERWEEAARQARAGLARWHECVDCRYSLAYLAAKRREPAEAAAQLDTLLATDPGEERALELYRWLREHGARGVMPP